MTRPISALLLVACTLFAGSSQTPAPAGEWKHLFDGKTTAGWRGYRKPALPGGWQVVDGALTRIGQAGDIVSVDEYENFELTVEWKIAPGGNSGIFYRVVENPEDTSMWMSAPEYQLIDDTGYPGTLKPTQKTAANYDLQPPGRDATKAAGSWNTTRILVNGSHVEHWLNGQLIVAYELWSDEWNRLVAASKFKDHPKYARARKGRIGIQDHGASAAFRNIRIRELPPTPQAPAPAQPASPIPATRMQTRWASQVMADGAPRPSSFGGRIAVHAHQARGGQFIDAGLVDVIEPAPARR